MTGEITLALTGAMAMQILSIGLRGILEKPVWRGEAIPFFVTLAGWVVFGMLDSIRHCRSMGSKIEEKGGGF